MTKLPEPLSGKKTRLRLVPNFLGDWDIQCLQSSYVPSLVHIRLLHQIFIFVSLAYKQVFEISHILFVSEITFSAPCLSNRHLSANCLHVRIILYAPVLCQQVHVALRNVDILTVLQLGYSYGDKLNRNQCSSDYIHACHESHPLTYVEQVYRNIAIGLFLDILRAILKLRNKSVKFS